MNKLLWQYTCIRQALRCNGGSGRQQRYPKLRIFIWGLYDLANQFFAVNVVSFFFVLWVTIEKQTPEIAYSISYALSVLCIALATPILGAVSDMTQRRQPFLVFFTFLSIAFTIALAWTDSVLIGLIFFAIANFGCQAAVVFYNALIVTVAPPNKIGFVSGIGKMMGYCGAIIGLCIIGPLALKKGYQASFLPTGVFFFLFALPCLIFIRDRSELPGVKTFSLFSKARMREIFGRLRECLFDCSQYPGLIDFYRAIFFGLCVINVVLLFMSVYATKVFGLSDVEKIKLIIFSSFFALTASLISGFISDRLGDKRTLICVFLAWVLCLLAGTFIRNKNLFWGIGALVGMSLGGTWVVSRAIAVRLVPQNKIGEVFGLFNLVGYGAAVVGALFWGLIIFFLSSLGEAGYRIADFRIKGFLLFALIFLLRIPAAVTSNQPHGQPFCPGH